MIKKQRKLDKRRRLEGKTNYTKRLILLKGGHLRLVVRKSDKYLYLQIVESVQAQDKIIFSVSTKELLKQGWPETKKGSLKSVSAGYLGGFLLGKKTKGLKKKVILDSGLIPNTKGSRIYAVVKGLSDSGVKINYDEKVIPSQERIQGKHMKEEFTEVFKKIKLNLEK